MLVNIDYEGMWKTLKREVGAARGAWTKRRIQDTMAKIQDDHTKPVAQTGKEAEKVIPIRQFEPTPEPPQAA